MNVQALLSNPATEHAIAHALARKGNRGDSMIAHINPAEAAMLRQAGGSGTINPRTGLLQFDPTGGSNAGGAGHAGDSGNNGGRGGGGSGTIGGGVGTGNRGPLGQGDAPIHTAGTSSPLGGAPTGDYAGVGSTYQGANSSYANRSFGDQALGLALGMIPGFHYGVKPNPQDPATYAGGTWHSGFNPGGAIGGIAGMATGMPGAGTIAGLIGDAISPTISFGSHAVTPGEAAIGINGGWMGGHSLGMGMGQGGNSLGHNGANGGGQHDGSVGAIAGALGGNGGGSGQPGSPAQPGQPATTPTGLPVPGQIAAAPWNPPAINPVAPSTMNYDLTRRFAGGGSW